MTHPRPNLKTFTWGPIRRVHEVGSYTIVEYEFTVPNDCAGRKKGDKEIRFACYTRDHDLCESAMSLDMALLICIANRAGGFGQHSSLAYACGKLLDIEA